MNIRKNIDYSDMYAALDAAMSAEKQQMKLYCKIGMRINRRCCPWRCRLAGRRM